MNIEIKSILYILMKRKISEIHILGGKIIESRVTFSDLISMLDEDMIIVCRGCAVSALAIHKISKKIELCNGEELDYTIRKKKQLIHELQNKKQRILNSLFKDSRDLPNEEYHNYYSSFDKMPFAFADIELVFNEEKKAIDWIFRYGNKALSKIERTPLDVLIGNSFSNVFPNMDSKWLLCYERVVLYGETLELMDYSPEIDTYLKIICFPTFKGHCGCILFDLQDIRLTQYSENSKKIVKTYFDKI